MKKEDLCDIIGDIDDRYIKSAKETKRRVPAVTKLVIAALVAALVLGMGAMLFQNDPEPPIDPYADLEPIAIWDFASTNGGAGLGQADAYDISDIACSNPWNERMAITDLPVFSNYLKQSEEMKKPIGADRNKMTAALLDAAERLGIKEDELIITDDAIPEEKQAEMVERMGGYVPEGFFELNSLYGTTDEVNITVYTDLTVTVSFKTPLRLPPAYQDHHMNSFDDANDIAKYLLESYKNIIKMDYPAISIEGGSYNTDLTKGNYFISFYEAGESDIDSIIGYNFKKLTFNLDSNKNIVGFIISAPDISEVAGTYPIITPDEAKDLFVKGHYFGNTRVSKNEAKLERIKRIELVYNNANRAEYFTPFYKITVETEYWALYNFEEDPKIKTYAEVYVPAIKSEWITNMPAYYKSFN